MSEAIHSEPTPWEDWYDYDDEGFITNAGVDTAGRAANVCVTTCENVTVTGKDEFNAYVKADTRLLACSPQMLAVCRQLVEFADRNRTINLKGRLAEAVGGARAVIARIKEKR
jgi:hypothetical protein